VNTTATQTGAVGELATDRIRSTRSWRMFLEPLAFTKFSSGDPEPADLDLFAQSG
jgi:hypothetical protein